MHHNKVEQFTIVQFSCTYMYSNSPHHHVHDSNVITDHWEYTLNCCAIGTSLAGNPIMILLLSFLLY